MFSHAFMNNIGTRAGDAVMWSTTGTSNNIVKRAKFVAL